MASIIWTRPKDRWDEDRTFLPKGARVEHIPLIDHIVNINDHAIKKKSQILVTSALAAEIIVGDEKLLSQVNECQVYTFSHRVEQIMGGTVHRVETNSMAQMLEILVQQTFNPNTWIYFLGAEVPAYPVSSHLEQLGFMSQQVPLYKTVELDSLSPKQIKTLEETCIICLASPSAARAMANLCQSYQLDTSHHIVAIGQTTEAEAVKYFQHTHVSAVPSVEAMMELAYELALEL